MPDKAAYLALKFQIEANIEEVSMITRRANVDDHLRSLIDEALDSGVFESGAQGSQISDWQRLAETSIAMIRGLLDTGTGEFGLKLRTADGLRRLERIENNLDMAFDIVERYGMHFVSSSSSEAKIKHHLANARNTVEAIRLGRMSINLSIPKLLEGAIARIDAALKLAR